MEGGLFCKDVFRVFEAFELQRVAAGVSQKHCGLLARFSFEAQARFDNEGEPCRFQPFRQCMEFIPRDDTSEMRHGNSDAIHLTCVARGGNGAREVRGNLMPEEIKIHPGLRASPFAALHDVTIEAPGLLKICNEERVMKG